MSELGHPEPFAVVTGGPLFDPERSSGLHLGSAKSCHSSEANHSHPRSTFGALATARPQEPFLGPRRPGVRSCHAQPSRTILPLARPLSISPWARRRLAAEIVPKLSANVVFSVPA